MKKIIILLLMIILISGCKSNEVTNKVQINCNKSIYTADIKKGDEIGCNLLGENYILKVTSSTDEEIKFEVNQNGLTDSHDLRTKQTKFTMKKDKELVLQTQSTDYQESITISWK